jgi:hypothetical protein
MYQSRLSLSVNRQPSTKKMNNSYTDQIIWLLLLSIPVACIAWTVTHEEVFREPRDYFQRQYEKSRTLIVRKFFYLFTCEYCFSHYVALVFLLLTHFHLLMTGWRGYLIAWFSLVWVANIYISLFGLLRTDLKKEKTVIKKMENDE